MSGSSPGQCELLLPASNGAQQLINVNGPFAPGSYYLRSYASTAVQIVSTPIETLQDPRTNADKNIVERPSSSAGAASHRVVSKLRKGLGETISSANEKFDIEVLGEHIKLLERSKVGGLIVILIAMWLAAFLLPFSIVAIWAAIGTGLITWSQLLIKRFRKLEEKERIYAPLVRSFQYLQAAVGVYWAALFWLHPVMGEDGVVLVLTFTAAMVLMGLSLVMSRFLRYGVLLTCLPFITIVAGRLSAEGSFASVGMAVTMIVGCFFFSRLGDLIRRSHFGFLHSRAERDQLIVELEAARSISEEARRRAEEANLAKSRFLATMSHELRTPLNAILGFSEIMANEVMGPLNNDHYKEYAGDIHSSGAHLLKLINEILDLSRVEAGRYELNEEATDLTHAAEESQQMVKLKAAQKNVTIKLQIHPDMPQIWADARAIRQVVLNLLSNALKFTPSGGTIWVKVGWTAGGGQYISIKDTGPGIPEEEIPIVLSSFGQGSIAIKSAEQGTGLGLPIVQALVHMHDGTFELKSKLREGTEVIATFPRKRVLEVMPAVPESNALSQGQRGRFVQRSKVPQNV